MTPVAVPQLFENMEEATIGRWLVSENQTIEKDAPLCELITEKTTLELPAPASGTVKRLLVAEKAIVPTHFVIAVLGEEDEELPDLSEINAHLETKTPEIPNIEPILAPRPVSQASPSKLRATPAARRAAKVAGVALEDVAAQFPGKVLSEEDVKAFAAR